MCASMPSIAAKALNPPQPPFSKKERRGDFLHVVAAAILNDGGQVLIARRPDHVHQGGKWEFPGGKVEIGESPCRALRRELFEELGISVEGCEPLIQIRHRYPDKAVLLDVWKVARYVGEPHGRAGQALAWVAREDLWRFAFPAANYPVLKALILPDVYLITPEPQGDEPSFLTRLETALRTGVRLVQLRAPRLEHSRYCELARVVLQHCRAHGARLMLNGEPEWVVRLNADGVHLNSARLRAMRTRPLPKDHFVAASCHDAEEIAHANRIDADFAVLSPVRPTPGHPGARALGWHMFGELCADATVPVYALGGMTVRDVNRAKEHGAQGIAAMRGLWAGLGLENK
jgi:8-oxo-dGTP diphosphatase